jgi:hypothetical protein
VPEFPYIDPKTQIENRNPLRPSQFRFTLARAPKVTFFSNQANLPSMSLGIANQATYLKDIPVPGDKINFEDLTLKFIVDEDLVNYTEIYNWIKGLGYPEDLEQIYDLQRENKNRYSRLNSQMNIYSDGTLQILTSNQRPNVQVKFYDLFPYDLTTLIFDATVTDGDPLTAQAKFKYTFFELTDLQGNPLYKYDPSREG